MGEAEGKTSNELKEELKNVAVEKKDIIMDKAVVDDFRNLNSQLQSLYYNVGVVEDEISALKAKKYDFLNKISDVKQKINNMSEIVLKTYNLDSSKKWSIDWGTGKITEFKQQR